MSYRDHPLVGKLCDLHKPKGRFKNIIKRWIFHLDKTPSSTPPFKKPNPKHVWFFFISVNKWPCKLSLGSCWHLVNNGLFRLQRWFLHWSQSCTMCLLYNYGSLRNLPIRKQSVQLLKMTPLKHCPPDVHNNSWTFFQLPWGFPRGHAVIYSHDDVVLAVPNIYNSLPPFQPVYSIYSSFQTAVSQSHCTFCIKLYAKRTTPWNKVNTDINSVEHSPVCRLNGKLVILTICFKGNKQIFLELCGIFKKKRLKWARIIS